MGKRFIKLTDVDNKGLIIRQDGHKFYEFIGNQWVRRGLSIGYFYPDAPEFDCYEEISESEVKSILGKEAIMD